MNALISAVLVCCLAISALGHHGGPKGGPHGGPGRGPPHGGPGGHGGPRGPPPSIYDMFPDCKTMADSMRTKHKELRDSGAIGPGTCQEQDRKICFQREMVTVRCAVPDEPQQACIDAMMNYIQGDVCYGVEGESEGGSIDSDNEDLK